MRDRDWSELYYELMRVAKAKVRADTKRQYRAKAKCFHDPLAKPLTEASRTRQDPNDWESMTEYGIDPGLSDYTDDELREFFEEQEICILSPYDCTGKVFTRWISWSRTPAGVAFIHRKGLDV